MSTVESTPNDLLFEFAFGGLAEGIDPETREDLHIETPVDDYLSAAIEAGHRVILSGNPGDGKTQHLLMHRSQHTESVNEFYQPDADEELNESHEIYYEPDGSRLSNQVVLDRLQVATDHEIPGILAINEGVIQEMIHDYRGEYPFLETIERQIRNQIVYESSSDPDQHTELNEAIQDGIEEFGIVVIDLGLRNVLTEETIGDAIDLIESLTDGPDGADNHITANVRTVCGSDHVRENLVEFLQLINESTPDTHYTVRDLLQFLAAIITGGKRQGRPDYGPEFEYYNLVFEQPGADRRGAIGKAVDELLTTSQLVHPQIDANLWTDIETSRSIGDDDDPDVYHSQIWEEFTDCKRKRLFSPVERLDSETADNSVDTGDETVLSFSISDLFHRQDASFDRFIRDEDILYRTIRMINTYFERESDEDGKLFLWTSHTYKSKSTDSLTSRTEVRAEHFECQYPTLNDELKQASSLDGVDQAIDFLRDHYQFTYVGETGSLVPIRVDSRFWESLQYLDIGIPYELRSDQQEQRLLRFMERVENRRSLSPLSGTVRVQDTAESDVVEIEIDDDSYLIGRE